MELRLALNLVLFATTTIFLQSVSIGGDCPAYEYAMFNQITQHFSLFMIPNMLACSLEFREKLQISLPLSVCLPLHYNLVFFS